LHTRPWPTRIAHVSASMEIYSRSATIRRMTFRRCVRRQFARLRHPQYRQFHRRRCRFWERRPASKHAFAILPGIVAGNKCADNTQRCLAAQISTSRCADFISDISNRENGRNRCPSAPARCCCRRSSLRPVEHDPDREVLG